LPAPFTAAADFEWVGAWGAAPAYPNSEEFFGGNVRQVVRLSQGGDAVRLVISNALGKEPLVIGAATVAKPGKSGVEIAEGSLRDVNFGGKRTVTIEPGQVATSDPVTIPVEGLSNISVSLYVSRAVGIIATHPIASATTYLAAGDDQSASTILENAYESSQRYFLARIDVENPRGKTIVTLGDSITDGKNSSPNSDSRWPDFLAARLNEAGLTYGVVNAGIAGNRIINGLPLRQFGPPTLERLGRDVLDVPNLSYVLFMEGINDIGLPKNTGLADQSVSAEEVIRAIQQVIDRVHQQGAKIIGSTLTPFENAAFANYYSTEAEAKRQAVNHWIRTAGAFDAVVDFDAVIRDPQNPARILEKYDSGDHLHPNDAGYKAMAQAVDLGSLSK
jgi:lysophospholipase L1-like esterase